MFFKDNCKVAVNLKGETQKSAITRLIGRIVLIFGLDCSSHVHPVSSVTSNEDGDPNSCRHSRL